jgi:hypothetical protein
LDAVVGGAGSGRALRACSRRSVKAYADSGTIRIGYIRRSPELIVPRIRATEKTTYFILSKSYLPELEY